MPPNEKTPFVLMLGAAGADKNSFIRVLRGRPGNATESKRIKSFYTGTLKFPVELVDTPGFTDDTLTDAAIFQDIAFAVADMRENERMLRVFIYVMNVAEEREEFTRTHKV